MAQKRASKRNFDHRRRLQGQSSSPLDEENQIFGRIVTGTRNANSELFASLERLKDLVLSNTTFQIKKNSLFTLSHNDNKTRNPIDYVLISKRKGGENKQTNKQTLLVSDASLQTRTRNQSFQISS